jgi:hypothetical protein
MGTWSPQTCELINKADGKMKVGTLGIVVVEMGRTDLISTLLTTRRRSCSSSPARWKP